MEFAVLQEINHWWQSGRVRDNLLEKVERDIFAEVADALDERQILLLEGPRRIGKTSLMYQLINRILSMKVDPRRIIYLSLDDPLIEKENLFGNLINLIENALLGEPLLKSKEAIYLFLDEVTRLEGWELYLKRYYDQKYPLKFIVSSSSVAFLRKKVKESLVGRIITFPLSSFSFFEVLKLQGGNEDLREIYTGKKNIWQRFIKGGSLQSVHKQLRKFEREVSFFKKDVDLKVKRYLLEGGFPEYLQLRNPRAKEHYFWENVVERTIFYDIPEIFRVEDRTLLQKLLIHSIFHSGSIINIVDLANSYDSPRQTISTYLNYLQASLLLQLLEKYARTAASRLRAFKKVYPMDTGLVVNLRRLDLQKLELQGLWGQLAEIAVFDSLRHNFPTSRFYYFRQRDKEVDFVLDLPERLLPVEVKYRGNVLDIRGLEHFREKFKVKEGIVVTKDDLGFKNNILYIPLRLIL